MFVAWRDLRFARGRFALMGTVVVLITALVGLLSGLTAGLGRENVSAVTGLPADHLAFSAPADGREPSFTDSSVTEEQWRRWAAAPGVESAEPLGVTTVRAGAAGRTASVSAFGVRPGSGLAPREDTLRDGGAVLSEGAAEELGLAPGGSLTLSGGRELTVAAVSGDASYSHTPVVWTSLDDWQHLARPAAGGGTGGDGNGLGDGNGDGDGLRATVIALTTAGGFDGAALAAADEAAGTETATRDDALQAVGSFAAENGSLQLMRGFLFVISALVVGAFFTVWTVQRSGDVAVLKALGASTGHLLRDALGQALVLLAAGTAVGTAIAAAAGAVLGDSVPFVLDAPTVAVPALVMTALGTAGAALSVRRITSVDPLTALGSAR